MTIEEIKHLGALSRLSLTDEEALAFSKEIDAILAYVGQVATVAGDGSLIKEPGVTYNVLREDEITVAPGTYTEALLAAAPLTEGPYVSVKKIIAQDE